MACVGRARAIAAVPRAATGAVPVAGAWRGGMVRTMAFVKKDGAKSTDRKQRKEVETNRMVDIFSRSLEPPPHHIPDLPPAVRDAGAALAKEYTRRMWKRHNEQQKDLKAKIRARMTAVWALPTDELRADALTVTDPLYPSHGRRAELLPPTAGFQMDRSLVQDPRMLEDSRFARMVKEEAALGLDVGEELLARASARRTEEEDIAPEEEEEEEAVAATTDDAADTPVPAPETPEPAQEEEEEDDDDDLII